MYVSHVLPLPTSGNRVKLLSLCYWLNVKILGIKILLGSCGYVVRNNRITASNKRQETILPVISTPYFPHSPSRTVHTVGTEHCQVNIWCQMNSYLSGTIWEQNITLSVQSTTIFPVMTPCRNELATTPDTAWFSAWTLNTQHCTRNMYIEHCT